MWEGEVTSKALGDLEVKGAVPHLEVLVGGQPDKRDDEEENDAAR